MKKEIRVFFTALMFFTRIPCPKWVDHSEEYLNKSSKYLPFIGWIVGGISGLVYFLCSYVLPHPIAILLSMAASIMVTGAFHEDGLADVCDGFGGGWTKEKILLIMKDSRIGAFGAIGIVMALLIKYTSIVSFSVEKPIIVVCVLIIGHSISRFAAITFLVTHEYARDDANSKSKPLATKLSNGGLVAAFIFGVLPLVAFSTYLKEYNLMSLILPVYITKMLLGRFYKKWIGGYTGDCLGATQQICEVVFYLSFIAYGNIFNPAY
ncbi:MAG TPA: adenosylcobinamide-GDP ribazoletransferase [Bacteroidia bacterium]|jgi:adenosylcobinamide-GDP ribazoletransferase|nr:adenosylcobinamide-GDP ribazoletransferase [Bacteroidia bacterium]